ncbi:MAG: FtsQ-type POTRA domain-containing protein [Lachnospiraceae bacterium]|nr:FtsQ-type POTRA domain-containing protein [Lachnospiraceae bacterium]HCJ08952.1 cell division protein FtsQ [Lachnospiraceae bacterium]
MSDRQDNVIQFKRRRTGVVVGGIAGVLVVGLILLFTCFKIDTIEVTGNKHYSKDQIKDYVLSEGYINNTVLLMLKNKIRPIEDIPFVAKLDVEYVSAHKITVTVYEKALAGCVEYMNEYVYFDQDGYVLEISPTRIEDTPCITGMSFESMELHEKLPIKDKDRFKLILKMTQLINKYKLSIDSIQFTSEDEIVMRYQAIRIELGDGSNIEQQLIDLGEILAGLEGKEGTLDLKDFDTAVGTASFKATK